MVGLTNKPVNIGRGRKDGLDLQQVILENGPVYIRKLSKWLKMYGPNLF